MFRTSNAEACVAAPPFIAGCVSHSVQALGAGYILVTTIAPNLYKSVRRVDPRKLCHAHVTRRCSTS